MLEFYKLNLEISYMPVLKYIDMWFDNAMW